MKKLHFKGRVAHALRVVAISVALVLGIAGPAAAGNVLFQYDTIACGITDATENGRINSCTDDRGAKVIGTVSGNTLMTTPTPSGGADFTIPSKIYSYMGSFSAAYPPVYPYFQASFTRYNRAGSLMAGNWTPDATLTFIDKDTLYPYATTPAPGFLRAKLGPKGMAGPVPFYARSYYTFTIVNGPVFTATALIIFNQGGPYSSNPNSAGFTNAYNTTAMTNTGIIAFLEPNIWAFTGTLTVSQPPPFAPTSYFFITAMDDRTPAGASGTIQVVSAALAHQYTVTPLPPPQDGTGTITSYRNGLAGSKVTTFQLLPTPEPGQIVLIGMGVVGLAGIWTRRRR